MSARHPAPEVLLTHCAHAVERARAHGAQVADACAEGSRAFTVSVHGGAVDTLKQSGTMGLGMRAIVDGAVGFASGTSSGSVTPYATTSRSHCFWAASRRGRTASRLFRAAARAASRSANRLWSSGGATTRPSSRLPMARSSMSEKKEIGRAHV